MELKYADLSLKDLFSKAYKALVIQKRESIALENGDKVIIQRIDNLMANARF